MKTKLATMITKNTDAKNFCMELRAGAQGKGKLIHTVTGWRDSSGSYEKAEEILAQVAHRKGYVLATEAENA